MQVDEVGIRGSCHAKPHSKPASSNRECRLLAAFHCRPASRTSPQHYLPLRGLPGDVVADEIHATASPSMYSKADEAGLSAGGSLFFSVLILRKFQTFPEDACAYTNSFPLRFLFSRRSF